MILIALAEIENREATETYGILQVGGQSRRSFDCYKAFNLQCPAPLAALHSQKVKERRTDGSDNCLRCASREELSDNNI